MTRRLIPALAGLLTCLVLLAGCGSSSRTTSTASSSTTSAPSSTSSSSTGTSSTPTTSVPADASPGIKAAVAQCKAKIHTETGLSGGAREKLEGACVEAAKGNLSAVKKVAREVCEETVNSSSLPQSAKEEADTRCRKD